MTKICTVNLSDLKFINLNLWIVEWSLFIIFQNKSYSKESYVDDRYILMHDMLIKENIEIEECLILHTNSILVAIYFHFHFWRGGHSISGINLYLNNIFW